MGRNVVSGACRSGFICGCAQDTNFHVACLECCWLRWTRMVNIKVACTPYLPVKSQCVQHLQDRPTCSLCTIPLLHADVLSKRPSSEQATPRQVAAQSASLSRFLRRYGGRVQIHARMWRTHVLYVSLGKYPDVTSKKKQTPSSPMHRRQLAAPPLETDTTEK